MDQSNIHFTSRIKRIMSNAEIEAQQATPKVLQPAHLLIACLKERTGVLGEIVLKCGIDINDIRAVVRGESSSNKAHSPTQRSFFNLDVTEEVSHVLDVAFGYMKRYNQSFLNEGHLLKALITTQVVNRFISEVDRDIILTHGTPSRDMMTHLGHYTFPIINTPHTIRKVQKTDQEKLLQFVDDHFSEEWFRTVREAFHLSDPQIYIALDKNDQTVIGFAGFNIYKNKKGYFGPMGVSASSRVKGLGFALLHHCLKDMKEMGYEYAIIGEAGPLEFYEKACQAVVIPRFDKGSLEMIEQRSRVFGTLIKGDSILMVHEVTPTRDYWTLPGGGQESGETFEEAVVREFQEEVNLNVKVVKQLFSSIYENGIETCFLVEPIEKDQIPSLGFDPELPSDQQTLKEVQWKLISTMNNDIQVAKVIKALNLEVN